MVGAQNAGKSSLINSLSGHKGGAKARDAPLTAAPLPGTTIGCVELPGVLPSPHKMWDTPGIIQASSPPQLQPYPLGSESNYGPRQIWPFTRGKKTDAATLSVLFCFFTCSLGGPCSTMTVLAELLEFRYRSFGCLEQVGQPNDDGDDQTLG